MNGRVAIVLLAALLSGCSTSAISASTGTWDPPDARAQCERGGGAWLAGPARCDVQGGAGGGGAGGGM